MVITSKLEAILAAADMPNVVIIADELDKDITALVTAGYLKHVGCASFGETQITPAGRKRLRHE